MQEKASCCYSEGVFGGVPEVGIYNRMGSPMEKNMEHATETGIRWRLKEIKGRTK